MKNKLFISLFILGISTFSSCSKTCVDKSTPECIASKIVNFQTTSLCSNATVKEYGFQGKMVFVFDHGSCGADMSAEVVDDNCQVVGMLGGIAGNTKVHGEDFSKAVFVRTVWQK